MKVKSEGSVKVKSYPFWSQQELKDSNGNWIPKTPSTSMRTGAVGSCNAIEYTVSKKPYITTQYCKHFYRESEDVVSSCSKIYWNAAKTNRWNLSAGGPAYTLAEVECLPFVPELGPSHNAALDYFKAGCMEQEVDLGNFVREAPRLKDMALQWWAWFKGTSRKLPSSGDIHLTKEFGLDPLIADVKDITMRLWFLQDHIRWLRKNSGKPVSVKYREELTHLGPSSLPPAALCDAYYEKISYKAYYAAHAVMVYDVGELLDIELSLRALVRAFGLDNPLGFLWEKRPWSFAIDWVFSVSRFLDGIAPKIRIPYKFIDSGWSIRVTEERTLFDMNFIAWNGGDAYFKRGFMKKKYYLREPGIPFSLGSVDLLNNTTDPSKLALAYALIQQKLKL